ncbi:MAG: hypothetical protein E7377_01460 [Clostridiales bacterium]|nr:hypothetical protein [Clostridiales bacterium]
MDLLREHTQAQLSEVELEAQKHNAMIKERYRRLQNAVAEQLATEIREEETKNVADVITPEKPSLYISPAAINTAVLEQTPQVTEYVSPAADALFTTKKFENMQAYNETQAVSAPVEFAKPTVTAEAVKEVSYSLTPFAKVVMAIFTLVIVAMLTLICVNTQVIHRNNIRIKNLEEKKEQLMEEYQDIQERIEAAKSEETIRQYAESQGMVWAGN